MACGKRIAIAAPRAVEGIAELSPAAITSRMIAHWEEELSRVWPDNPDLVTVPEVCDRPAGLTRKEQREYYRERGEQVLEFFRKQARSHSCNMVYSAVRESSNGTWRNSSVILGRKGEILGVYDKNHVVIEETTAGGVLCGNKAAVIEFESIRAAPIICFDLNFVPVRERYQTQAPNLILFSSVYHGGLMQEYWAYACRSYFAGAVSGLPSQIRNPFGEVIASTTNYQDHVCARINLDFCLAHLDYNREKLRALKDKYAGDVTIYDPGFVGSVCITSESTTRSAAEMTAEFEIELLDDYFQRALEHHTNPDNIAAEGENDHV